MPHDVAVVAPLEIVLADDAAHYRRGLAAVLSTVPGLTVVAEAGSGEQLIEAVEWWAPDVAVIDLRMPGMGGVAATAAIARLSPVTNVLVLSVSDEEEDLLAAVVAGARGYLLKDNDIEEVPNAVRAVASGGAPVSPVVAGALWRRYDELRATGGAFLAPAEEHALRLRAAGVGRAPVGDPAVVERRLADAAQKVRMRWRSVSDSR
ncbi:MAG: response regulator transcription factor [Solirubrobacterales bacterium]|nr:response regulator transcription factor [Solirubrobacterales bacterium]